MSLINRCLTVSINKSQFSWNIFRSYAKPPAAGAKGGAAKKLGKLGPIVEKKVLPVEEDTNKLVNYVCGSNIMTKGEDIKIKPDSEYPDWLWKLHTGPPKPISELDPNTKEYWRRVRRAALTRNNTLAAQKRF
ncbi:large ribosomal subunit protein mL54 [Culicoides brevitarsis]|uniref:large ribosomal subunit protein mL54 n=1 Tax=Culicoides brevitarsis TaxID=469753 RepID=UPI00307B173A